MHQAQFRLVCVFIQDGNCQRLQLSHSRIISGQRVDAGVLTGDLIITPLLVVLLLFTNDFVTMSISTDRVPFSRKPERWKIRDLVMTALPLAALILVLSFTIFFSARNVLHLPLPPFAAPGLYYAGLQRPGDSVLGPGKTSFLEFSAEPLDVCELSSGYYARESASRSRHLDGCAQHEARCRSSPGGTALSNSGGFCEGTHFCVF